MNHKWTNSDNEFIKENYLKLGVNKCAKHLGVSSKALKNRASIIGINIRKNWGWTLETDKFLKENYSSKGSSYCSDILNKPKRQVQIRANKLGIIQDKEVRKYIWTKEKKEFLKKNYAEMGRDWCSDKLKMTKISVGNQANKLGLKVSNERISKSMSIISSCPRPTLCKVDCNSFIKEQSKEMAYSLGILWADGWINNKSQSYKIALELNKEDFDFILPVFQKTGTWGVYYRDRADRKPQGSLHTSNKTLYGFLEKHNYLTKSISSADSILSTLRPEYLPYWWRGYFDGDGCWYINEKNKSYQMSIAGSYHQDWNFVEKLLNYLKIKYKIVKRIFITKKGKENKSSIVRCTNINGLFNFGEYIYANGLDIGLKRKYAKYQTIKEKYYCNLG